MISSGFLWLALAIILVICEVLTVGLFCIWFAVGALGGLVACKLGAALWVQLIIFAALSAVALLLVRPLTTRLLQQQKRTPTNADRILGRQANVIQEIDNTAGTGQINVSGQIWTARSEPGSVLPIGSQVRILRIEGVKAFVEPLQAVHPGI